MPKKVELSSAKTALYLKEEEAASEIRRLMRWRLWRIRQKARRAAKHGGNIGLVPLPRSTDHMSSDLVARVATELLNSEGLPLKCVTYPSNLYGANNSFPRHLIIRSA